MSIPQVHKRNATYLYSAIESLEGLWVKLGQYVSSRADVMPPEYLTALAQCQEMPPSPPNSKPYPSPHTNVKGALRIHITVPSELKLEHMTQCTTSTSVLLAPTPLPYP